MCRSPLLSGRTRAASVTIPTHRPSPSTTGTPGSSLSRSVLTTSSTLSAGSTVSGFESMMSRTAWATAPTLAGQARREPLDHVAGHHVIRAVPLGGGAAGADVRERPERGGLERAEALGEKRADQSGEDVARPGGR